MRLGSSVAVLLAQAVATAPIQPLAWELLYASGVALKRPKKKKHKRNKHQKRPQKIASVSEDVEELGSLCVVGGNEKWYSC